MSRSFLMLLGLVTKINTTVPSLVHFSVRSSKMRFGQDLFLEHSVAVLGTQSPLNRARYRKMTVQFPEHPLSLNVVCTKPTCFSLLLL